MSEIRVVKEGTGMKQGCATKNVETYETEKLEEELTRGN